METIDQESEEWKQAAVRGVLGVADTIMDNLHTRCTLPKIRARICRYNDNEEPSDDGPEITWAFSTIVQLAKLMEWTDKDPEDDATVWETVATLSQINKNFRKGQQIFADTEGPIGMIARLVTMLQASTLKLHAHMLKYIDISEMPFEESPALLEKMKAIVTRLNKKCADAGLNPIAPTLVEPTGFSAAWGALADTIRKLLGVLRRHHLAEMISEACSTLSLRSITEREKAFGSTEGNVANNFMERFQGAGNALRASIRYGTPSAYDQVATARFYLAQLIETAGDWMAPLGKSVRVPIYTGSTRNARIAEAWIHAGVLGYTMGPVELNDDQRAILQPMVQRYQQTFKDINVYGSASSIESILIQLADSYANVMCYNTSLVVSIPDTACHPPMVIPPPRKIVSVDALCQSLTCHTIPNSVAKDLEALVGVLPELLGKSAYKQIVDAHMKDDTMGALQVLFGIRLDTLEFLLEFWSQDIAVPDRKAYHNFNNVLTILSKILVPGGANPSARVKAHLRKGKEACVVTVKMDPETGELSAAFCSTQGLGTFYLTPTVVHNVRDTSKIVLFGFTSGDVSMQMDLAVKEIYRLLELQLAKLQGNHNASPLDGLGSQNTTGQTEIESSHKRIPKNAKGVQLTDGLVQQEVELENARAELEIARAELEIATQRIKSLEEENKQLCRRLKGDNDEDTDLGDDTDSDDDTINQPPKRRKVPAPATDDPYKEGDMCLYNFGGCMIDAKVMEVHNTDPCLLESYDVQIMVRTSPEKMASIN